MALNRRALIQSSLLVPALAHLTSRSASAGPAAASIWIIDAAMPGARWVDAEAQAAAATVYRFSSDPGRLWFHDLAPKLRTAPVALGGYTSAPTLFCLHYLAREHGLSLAAIGRTRAVTGPQLAPIDLDPTAPAATAVNGNVPIDLRDPRFSNPHTAHSWLMLPRRT